MTNIDPRKFIVFARLLFVLGLLVGWRPTPAAAFRSAEIQDDEDDDVPIEVTLDNGFLIVFTGAYENDDGSSTWVYEVAELPGSQDLGNWVLELPDCAPALSAYPEPWEAVHPDPNTGLNGVKWEVKSDFTLDSFSVTVEGQWATGVTQVGAKNSDVALGEIAGPVCESSGDDGGNDPVAHPDSYTTGQDTLLEVGSSSGVLANDEANNGGGDDGNENLYDGGDDESPLTAHLASGPSHGDLELNEDGSFTYIPDSGFSGEDTFTYTARQGESESAPATVTLTVTASGNGLVANDDSFEVEGGEVLSVAAPGVLDNDSGAEKADMQAGLASSPKHGELDLNGDGSFTYTPEAGFFGEDAFTYSMSAGDSESNTATATIQVLDLLAPSVTWLSPAAEGAVVDVGTSPIVLEASAEDNWGIASVSFIRWDAVNERYVTMGILEEAPYRLEVDPESLNPEWNQVFAVGLDEAGNESNRPFLWLYRTPAAGSGQSFSLFLPLAIK